MASEQDILDAVTDYVERRTGWGDSVAWSLAELERHTGYSPSQLGHVLGQTPTPYEGFAWDRLEGTAWRFHNFPPVGGDPDEQEREVVVEVVHESMERGNVEKTLRPGDEVEFTNDEPTYTRISVVERGVAAEGTSAAADDQSPSAEEESHSEPHSASESDG